MDSTDGKTGDGPFHDGPACYEREVRLEAEIERLRRALDLAECERDPACDEAYYQQGKCLICETQEYFVDKDIAPSREADWAWHHASTLAAKSEGR